jgi:hypothetical protein
VREARIRRLVAPAAVLAIVLPLALMVRANVRAYDHEQFCTGEYLVPDSSVGAVDPRAALQHLLVGGREPDLPPTGWTGPSIQGEFTSGSARVTVERFRGSEGWFATGVCTAGQAAN